MFGPNVADKYALKTKSYSSDIHLIEYAENPVLNTPDQSKEL